MKLKKMLHNETVTYEDFYNALRDLDLGYWDGICSTDTLIGYVNHCMEEKSWGSHVLTTLEHEDFADGDWKMDFTDGSSPSFIHNKQELADALYFSKKDLEVEAKKED